MGAAEGRCRGAAGRGRGHRHRARQPPQPADGEAGGLAESGSVPEGAFENAEELNDRVVKTSVQRGEAILDSKLAPVGTKGGLSAVISEGNRAMTVRVNDVIGVAGFALPGNYVDVVVSTQRDGSGNDSKQISKIVLEHILVLAVAQEANRDETKPKVVSAVTLEVTPERGREARPGAQRGHALAGAAQPGRQPSRATRRASPSGNCWSARRRPTNRSRLRRAARPSAMRRSPRRVLGATASKWSRAAARVCSASDAQLSIGYLGRAQHERKIQNDRPPVSTARSAPRGLAVVRDAPGSCRAGGAEGCPSRQQMSAAWRRAARPTRHRRSGSRSASTRW